MFNIKGFGVGVNLFMRYGYLSNDSKNFRNAKSRFGGV